MSCSTPLVIIGNPENRRVTFFQEALRARALARALVVPYREIVEESSPERLADRLPVGSLVRIDSPGENFTVDSALIRRGGGIPSSTEDHGRLHAMRQWYMGFCSLLDGLFKVSQLRPDVTFLQDPRDIALVFDKPAASQRLKQAGIPVPREYGRVRGYDDLLRLLACQNASRVFLKPAHGSSASGVVAYERSFQGERATTSVELCSTNEGLRLYNSLRVRSYSRVSEIRQLVDALASEHLFVQQWIPKAGIGGLRYDFRLLIIDGAARHGTLRLGKGPITNLHLGGKRRDIRWLQGRLGQDGWARIVRTCEKAASLFRGLSHVGLDVIIDPTLRRHAIVEANAFGDLLPGLLDRGETTYEAIVSGILARSCPSKGSST